MTRQLLLTFLITMTAFPTAAASQNRALNGETIELIDFDRINWSRGNTGGTAPMVFRYCIDGYEYIAITQGNQLSFLQAMDRNGKPKQCGAGPSE